MGLTKNVIRYRFIVMVVLTTRLTRFYGLWIWLYLVRGIRLFSKDGSLQLIQKIKSSQNRGRNSIDCCKTKMVKKVKQLW